MVPQRDAARLVGRDGELSTLEEQLDRAVATGRRIVLLAGEAGLGKTALVEAFASSLAGRRTRVDVVRGLCVPMGEAGLPFTPVLGLLRAIEELHGTDRLVEWAGGGRRALGSLLPDLLQPAEPADDLQLQLFEAVTRVVQGAAAVAPLVVLVEDVHWADESSRALLQFLARRLGEAPVLLVCTFRPDEVTGPLLLRPFLADLVRLPWTVRIDLSRLGRAEVASMLSALGGPRPTAELVDQIHRRSEGVPFYVEELAMLDRVGTGSTGVSARRTGGSHQPARRAGSGAPGPDGGRGDPGAPRAADRGLRCGLGGGRRDCCERPSDAGVVRVDGDELAFRHALFGEALYADLLPGERIRHHASVAQTLERRPGLAPGSPDHVIALHWSRTSEHERTFAAAARAVRSGSAAHAETLAMCERLLELWDKVADPEAAAGPRAELLTDAARAGRDAGEFDRAIELVSAALEESDEADLTGRVERLMLRSHPGHRRPPARRSCRRAARREPARGRRGRGVQDADARSGRDLPAQRGARRAAAGRGGPQPPASRRPTRTGWRPRARRTAPSSCRWAGTRRGSRSSVGPAPVQGSVHGPCCATGSTTPTRST